MDNIALEVFDREGTGSKFMVLPSNTSITITDTSEIFDSGDVWTHSFKVNIPLNAHIFGTSGDLHGSRLHEQVDKRRARLYVMGIPMYYGYLRLEDEVEVEENGDVDISFESGRKTFLQMVEGVKANQVPIPDDILIGIAHDRERTIKRTDVQIAILQGSVKEVCEILCNLEGVTDMAQIYPKYVTIGKKESIWRFADSNGGIITHSSDFINTDTPYNDEAPTQAPYCNIRICYQKKKFETNNNGEIEEKSAFEYKLSEATRANTAPNFFVLYWFRILMQHLGIIVEENQMLAVEDLKRLFFVNTKCAYKPIGHPLYEMIQLENGYYRIEDSHIFPKCMNYQKYEDKYYGSLEENRASPFVPIPDSGDDSDKTLTIDVNVVSGSLGNYNFAFRNLGYEDTQTYLGTWHKACATSDNFPNVEIKDVVDAIESGFGVRLMFNGDYTKVRAVLLRNIFRNQEVHELPGITTSETKQENSIRGFRLTYGVEDDDTAYNYKGFKQLETDKNGGWVEEEDLHDYSQWNTELGYSQIKTKVGTLNKTCYIDPATGNAYIVKIDKDARSFADKYNPSLFTCADFMDAEDGDCTGEEETIKEVRIGFSPLVVNNINESYALFVNEEMGVSRSEVGILQQDDEYNVQVNFGTINIREIGDDYDHGSYSIEHNGTSNVKPNDLESNYGLFEIATTTEYTAKRLNGEDEFPVVINGTEQARIKISGLIKDGYRLHLDDNYKPNDEMECPLEKHDWQLMFGIMRGSGSGANGARVTYNDDNEEGENNDYWKITPGAIAVAHSDTCDDNGNPWDYRPVEGTTGYEHGDIILDNAGAIKANIKYKKGPSPSGLDVYAIIDTYFYTIYNISGSYLSILTSQGYYAIKRVIQTKDDVNVCVWLCCVIDGTLQTYNTMLNYINHLQYGDMPSGTPEQQQSNYYPDDVDDILSRDTSNLVISATLGKYIPLKILKEACEAYVKGNELAYYDYVGEPTEKNGLISLKLRAEKPNPYFDPSQPETKYDPEHPELNTNPRYLTITNPALRHRGLMDQFYKEYSYWVRNARIKNKKRRMELADILSIDKTVRQRVDDLVGFVKKMQFSVGMQTGLGPVELEVLYL